MKRILFAQFAMVALVAAAVAFQQVDDKSTFKDLFKQYVEKFGPPGPEHKNLESLVGTWQARCRTWTSPNEAPQVSEGTLHRKLFLGGRFIHEDFDGKLMDQPYQGMGTIGFDRAKRKYVTVWVDSMNTATNVSHGTYDGGTWTFKHEDDCPITGKRVKMRDTLRIVNDNEQVMEMYRQLGDEKEMRTMEIVLTRKK
jgi:hypothetical protein